MRMSVKIVVVILVVAVFFSVGGCTCTKASLAVERVAELWSVNGPRLQKYMEDDPVLKADPDSLKLRIETVQRMNRAVKDAQEATK